MSESTADPVVSPCPGPSCAQYLYGMRHEHTRPTPAPAEPRLLPPPASRIMGLPELCRQSSASTSADPVVFLNAALDRVEQLARLINSGGFEPQSWHIEPTRSPSWVQIVATERMVGEPPGTEERYDDRATVLATTGRAEHVLIALHDPAYVVRRVTADRQILAEHQPKDGHIEETWRRGSICGTCAEEDRDGEPWGDAYPCRTVLLLAEGYGWTGEAK